MIDHEHAGRTIGASCAFKAVYRTCFSVGAVHFPSSVWSFGQ
jgi:hypothetical protein